MDAEYRDLIAHLAVKAAKETPLLMDEGESVLIVGLTFIDQKPETIVGLGGTPGALSGGLVNAMHAIPALLDLFEQAVHQYRLETDDGYREYQNTIRNQ